MDKVTDAMQLAKLSLKLRPREKGKENGKESRRYTTGRRKGQGQLADGRRAASGTSQAPH